MLILDTDILTIIQFGRGELYTRIIKQIARYENDAAVTVVSLEEQMRGWLSLIARKRDASDQLVAYDRLLELLEDFKERTILRFDEDSARIFTQLRRIHRRTGAMDLKIAAITLANRATLATRNANDFSGIEGLSVIDPTIDP